jgi:hypothetical protein
MAPGAQEQARRESPKYPQGQGFIAAIKVKLIEYGSPLFGGFLHR